MLRTRSFARCGDLTLARRIRGEREDGERVGSGAYKNRASFKNLPVTDKDWQNPKVRKRAEEKKAEEETGSTRKGEGSGGQEGKERGSRPGG
jgi:hypothetical protein